MTLLDELRGAVVGWRDVLTGRPQAEDRFNFSAGGLGSALFWYFAMVVLTIVVQGLSFGAPSYQEMLLGIVVNALPLFALSLVILLTTKLVAVRRPVYALLIPTAYAMTFTLVIGLPLALIGGGQFGYAILGVLGYMLYRAARAIAGLGIGVSIAFAVLSIVVLVALPIALYMVTMPVPPAT